MASVMPDLQLPSQLQRVNALWPVPNCTAWRHRHTCETTHSEFSPGT